MLSLNSILNLLKCAVKNKKSYLIIYNPSSFVISVLKQLYEARLIRGFVFNSYNDIISNGLNLVDQKPSVKIYLNIYNSSNFLLINDIHVYSTSSVNYKVTVKQLRRLISYKNFNFNFYILMSTSFGLMSAHDALRLNIGGVLLFRIE